jgi:hypothetical protein
MIDFVGKLLFSSCNRGITQMSSGPMIPWTT